MGMYGDGHLPAAAQSIMGSFRRRGQHRKVAERVSPEARAINNPRLAHAPRSQTQGCDSLLHGVHHVEDRQIHGYHHATDDDTEHNDHDRFHQREQ
jgi:hypothetical protein